MGDFFDDFIDMGNPVHQKPWMPSCQFILGTVENLSVCVDACIKNGRFGLDLETSGLDNRVKKIDGIKQTVDKIAGVCISPDGVQGYYFPLHHKVVAKDGSASPHPANLSIQAFAKEFKRLMAAVDSGKTIAIFHHGKFDQEFLEFNETGESWGNWDKTKSWDDTMIMGYLRNSRARSRRLKDMSAALPEAQPESPTGGPGLGMEMIELYELFGHDTYKKGFNYDFTTLDPTEQWCLWYAGSDAICTYRLRDLLLPSIVEKESDGQNQVTAYSFEKACVAATRWMERNRLHVDRPRILELIQVGQKEWFDAILTIYTEAEKLLGRDVTPGVYRALKTIFNPNDPQQLLAEQLRQAERRVNLYEEYKDPISKRVGKDDKEWPVVYDVGSAQQLGTMFEELGVPGLKHTDKSGQVATDKKEIERIIDEAGDQFPFMGRIRWFREIDKALTNYLTPLYVQSDMEDDTARINFRQDGTDTGRFATPSKDNKEADFIPGFPQVNVHSIPKASDSEKHPECLNRVRECITCRPPEPGKPRKYMAACDYSGEELRLITTLSREPKWLKEFFHCSGCDRMFDAGDGTKTPEAPPSRCPNCGSDKIGDIHTLTGLSVYGQDANKRSDWKELRGKSKSLNFALSYGGGGSAAMRATGVDKQEGWRLKNTFDRTYLVLKSWWDAQHEFAKKYGFVRTAFGRKYPLPDIASPDGGFRSKAERNAVNGPVQGCIVPDCRIMTMQGVFTVKELWDRQLQGQKRFKVWTGKNWAEAQALFSGEKLLVHTQLTDGRVIKTSPEHLFRVYEDGDFKWVRQENLDSNSWIAVDTSSVDQTNPCPSHLANWIGNAVCVSSAYSTLSEEQKKEIQELQLGKGTRAQCLRYLGLLPVDQTHRSLQGVLAYDYLKLKSSHRTGETVTMYDVEVFDDDHAFVCDGVIVHNTGADICKVAMALVYKEMKTRGWLDKVMMVMTMHDELVFEIDADILEEVLPLLVNIMARNPIVLGMNWPVPLTCDVEIGHDWTVPWHMTEMQYGEIRFIGNKKYKAATKKNAKGEIVSLLPEGVVWDNMQRYPDELKPWISLARGEAPQPQLSAPTESKPAIVSTESPEAPLTNPESTTPTVSPEPSPFQMMTPEASLGNPPVQAAPVKENLPPPMASGESFTYTLNVPLTVGSLIKMAEVIHQCQNKGMAVLKLVSRTGEPLKIGQQDIRVNATTFYVLAQHFGL